jgi:hypothetical protein
MESAFRPQENPLRLAFRGICSSSTFTIRTEDGEVAGLRWCMPPIVRSFSNIMLSMDEPDHKRLRDIDGSAASCRCR